MKIWRTFFWQNSFVQNVVQDSSDWSLINKLKNKQASAKAHEKTPNIWNKQDSPDWTM